MSEPNLPRPMTSAETGGTPIGVLVVDDEPMIRELAQRTLERRGYRTFQAENGRVAIETLERSAAEIAVVVLDLTMPGLTGEQTLAVLHARWPALRVVLMSGHSMQGEERGARGVFGHIEKPYLPHELLRVVEDALSR